MLPGSHLLTFFDARGQAEPEAWLKKLGTIAAADQPVVLICRSGRRSAAVSRLLSEHAGYAKVYNAKGGIVGWHRRRASRGRRHPGRLELRQGEYLLTPV